MKDWTGTRWDKVTAIENLGVKTSSGAYLWKMRCDCGTEFSKTPHDTSKLITASCGCEKSSNYARSKHKEPGLAAFNSVLNSYKNGARHRSLEFSITDSEFRNLTSSNCHYCNARPARLSAPDKSTNGSYIYNGIDRKDNSIGYVTSNCVSCCWDCNNLKGSRSYNDFINMIRKIYDNRYNYGRI